MGVFAYVIKDQWPSGWIYACSCTFFRRAQIVLISNYLLSYFIFQMPGCTFQSKWLSDNRFKGWLKAVPNNKNAAECAACRKTVDLSTMGVTALTSHAKGAKHSTNLNINSSQGSIQSYVEDKTVTRPSDTATIELDTFVSKTDTLKAETLWSLKTVHSNMSYSSNEDVNYFFREMFPDSAIAKSFSCGETKSMYIACYGISPYIQLLLENKVKNQPYVMLFDESLNVQLQKKQLDIHLRFWDNNAVQSIYYTSAFLGHATALDLINCFETHVERKIRYANLVQVSMDGPNVNWAVFDKLQTKLETENNKKLLNIGSCGLHTLHNAFKAAVSDTDWDIGHKLSALHTLFDETPARREDYEKVTRQQLYPLQFCAHRWVENVCVFERAIEVMPHMKVYVENVSVKAVKNPGTKSYESVKDFCKDPLSKIKLAFLVSVAKPIETFLTSYQTDKPMIPFLSKDLEMLIKHYMNRFVKPELRPTGSLQKLTTFDVNDKKNQKSLKHIDIGFIADQELKVMIVEKKVSERAAMDFRSDCLKLLVSLVKRLQTKSPLSYGVVTNLSCLEPGQIYEQDESNHDKFRRVLTVLVSSNRLDVNKCDEIEAQYDQFVEDARHMSAFKDFSKDKDRVDELFFDSMSTKECYNKLWDVVSVLLLLSHGQASVERGFSVNKEVSEYNQSEHNLIARRVIKSHINHVGLQNIVITKELLVSVQGARQKYHAHLESKRIDHEKRIKSEKRKLVEEELQVMRKKQKQIETDITSLNKDADRNSEKAETLQSLTYIAKANALRRKAKDKAEEMITINKMIYEKSALLKNM